MNIPIDNQAAAITLRGILEDLGCDTSNLDIVVSITPTSDASDQPTYWCEDCQIQVPADNIYDHTVSVHHIHKRTVRPDNDIPGFEGYALDTAAYRHGNGDSRPLVLHQSLDCERIKDKHIITMWEDTITGNAPVRIHECEA